MSGAAKKPPAVKERQEAGAEHPGAADTSRLDGLRRSVLRKQIESADGVLDVDPDKKPMDQTEALEMLGAKARILIDSLLRGEAFKAEDVEKYTDFQAFIEALKTESFQKAMAGDAYRLIAAELQKMAASEGDSAKFWADEQCWAGLLRDQVSKFNADIPEGGKEKKDKSLWEKHAPESVKKFFKDNPTVATFGKILAVGAGAYGAFRLLKWMISPSDKKPESERGLFDKIRSAVAWPIGILTGVGLGAWLGGKLVRELIKDTTGMDIANLGEVIKAFREGRYADGWRLLKQASDPNELLHHSFREEIEKKYKTKLDNGVLVVFGKDDYQTFRKTSFTDRAARAVERISKGAGEEGGLVMGLLGNILDANPEAVLESKALNDIFEKLENDGVINPAEMQGKPLDDVMAIAIDRMKSGTTAKKGAGGEKKKEEPGFVAETAEKMGESAERFGKDFLDTYASWMPGSVKEAVDKWKKASGLVESWEAAQNFLSAIWDHKMMIAVSGGAALIWTGSKWAVMSTARAIVMPLYELATLHPKGAVQEYLVGTTPFIALGVGRGLLAGKGVGKIGRAFQGALEGLGYPANVANDILYYGSKGRGLAHLETFGYGVETRVKGLGEYVWSRIPFTSLQKEEAHRRYVTDRLLFLQEQYRLNEERITLKRHMPFGTSIKKWEKMRKNLSGEIDEIEKGMKGVPGAEEMVKEARLARLMGIYGDKYKTVLEAVLADEKVGDIVLFGSNRSVIKEILALEKPQEILKGLTEIKDPKIIALVRQHALLRDKNFVRLLRKTPDLFANGALDQAKLEQLVEDAAKAPGRFRRFMTGLAEILGKFKDWTMRRKAIQKLCDSLEGFKEAVSNRMAASSPARRLRQAMEAYRDFRGVKLGAEDMAAIANLNDYNATRELLRKKGFNVSASEAAHITEEAKTDLSRGEDAIKALAETKGVKLMVSPELTVWMRRAQFAGRALAGAGVAFSAVMAGFDFYKAATTDVKGRGKLHAGRGVMYGTNAAIDTAVLLGVKGGTTAVSWLGGMTVSATGAAAAALAPTMYMGDAAFESSMEGTKTVKEWSETEHTQLVHEWMSTGLDEEFTAGDAYRAVLPFAATEEQIRQEHRETRKKNLAALICQEDGTTKPDADRMAYFEKTWGFGAMESYDKCLILLQSSKIYAIVQQTRQVQKAAGVDHYEVGGVDIMEARFDNPSSADMGVLIEAEKKSARENLDPNIRRNAALLSDAALIEFYEQACLNFITEEEGIEFVTNLRKYLAYERGINVDQIEARVADSERGGKKIESKVGWASAMQERLLSEGDGMQAAVEEEKSKITDAAGSYALYKLAQFFGYHGYQNEAELKQFFTEERKNALGVYWNGSEWVVNEEGLESDNEVGSELNKTTVQAMITEMREAPKNILEHRQRAIVFSPGDEAYGRQVVQMAKILEDGLKDYAKIKSTRPAPAAPAVAANDDREKAGPANDDIEVLDDTGTVN